MNQSRTRMARKPQSARKKPARGKKRLAKKSDNLKQTFYSLGLWALGIMNAILIASFVMKHISTGDEQVLSVEENKPAVTRSAPPQLEVLNGCGVPGIAKKFADHLESAGFVPANVDNFENFNMPTTLIIDRKSKNRKNGLKIAELLGLPATAVLYQASPDRQVDVSVIIGKDYPRVDFLRSAR